MSLKKPQMSQLPIELVLRVLESLVPENAIAMPLMDSATRTILVFMRISRATYPVAIKLLYKHALCIMSTDRLRRLLVCLDMHLQPARAMESTLPKVDLVSSLQNLFLVPYLDHIDDLPAAMWIFELAAIMRHSSRRLLVKIPCASLPREADHLAVLPKLSSAFSQLCAVEEAIVICQGCSLRSTHHTGGVLEPAGPIWKGWYKLRRLALRGVRLHCEWEKLHLDHLDELQTLVFIDDQPHFERGAWNGLLSNLHQRDLLIVCVSHGWSATSPMSFADALEDIQTSMKSSTGCQIKVELRQFASDWGSHFISLDEWYEQRALEGRLFDLSYLDSHGAFTVVVSKPSRE